MPKKKLTFEDFKNNKEYILWGKLNSLAVEFDWDDNTIYNAEKVGWGYYEPFFVMLFKVGVTFKYSSKWKEIKMDWIRPINYLDGKRDDIIKLWNRQYIIDKGAVGNADLLQLKLSHLFGEIRTFDTLDESNFQETYKRYNSTLKEFFMALNAFVKDGFRILHENIKVILKPLRWWRKSGFRLFVLEQQEAMNKDITQFKSRKDFGEFTEGVKTFFSVEEYKKKRDCDWSLLNEQLGRELKRNYYEYKYSEKIRTEEEEIENETNVTSPNAPPGGKPEPRKIEIKKNISVEEKEAKAAEEEKYKLKNINIEILKQPTPNSCEMIAYHKQFEEGISAIYVYLNEYSPADFSFQVDSHKIFINLNKIPEGRKLPQTDYFLGQLADFIQQLKIMCYEMKVNGLSRCRMPITENIELIALLKKLYDMHNIIDRIMGDKLLYEQYMFIYENINFVNESSWKEAWNFPPKQKELVEYCIPRYVFFQAMRHSVQVLRKMISKARAQGGHYDIKDFYQPTNYDIDMSQSFGINDFEVTDLIDSDTLRKSIHTWYSEIDQYGRFWLFQGLFPLEDKEKWWEAIVILETINDLVQEDIRDMLLLKYEEQIKTEEESKREDTKNSLEDRKLPKGKLPRRNSKSQKSTKVLSRTLTTNKKRKPSLKDSSWEEEPSIVLPKKIEDLRPPQVWNFPINRILNAKKETKRYEVRKVNPFICYKDKRVERFLEVFDEIMDNVLFYHYKRQNSSNQWEYVLLKVFEVLQIKYSPSSNEENKKEKEPELTTEEKKEEEVPKETENNEEEKEKEEENHTEMD